MYIRIPAIAIRVLAWRFKLHSLGRAVALLGNRMGFRVEKSRNKNVRWI